MAIVGVAPRRPWGRLRRSPFRGPGRRPDPGWAISIRGELDARPSPYAARALAGFAFAFGFVVGLVTLRQFGFLEIWEHNIFGGDFSQFWVGAHVFVTGGNPYDAATWPGNVERLGGQDAVTPVFLYPGWVPVLLAPLGLLALPTAAALWIGATLLFAAIGLFLLLDIRAGRLPLAHTLLGYALVASEPGIVTFYSGQWGFFLVGALALLSLSLYRRWQIPAGVAACALLMKPQLFLLAAPSLARVAIARRQPRVVVVAVIVAAVLVALSAALLPRWWEAWSTVPQVRAGDIRAATPVNALRDTFGDPGLLAGVAVVAAMIALAFAFSPRSYAAWPVWLMVSLTAAPYVFVYDHILAIVPLALAIAIVGEHRPRRALVVAALGFFVLVIGGTLLHAFPGLEHRSLSYNGAVLLTLSALVIAALWPYRKERIPGL